MAPIQGQIHSSMSPKRESKNRHTHTCDFSTMVPKLVHGGRGYLSNKQCWKKMDIHTGKKTPKFNPYVTPHIKVYLK